MKTKILLSFGLSAVIGTFSAQAQVTISALTSFGINGWDASGSNPYVTTGTTERGLTFADGEVWLTSRASVSGSSVNVVEIDAATGAVDGTLNNSGITGGTFAIDGVAAGSDGALYVVNLTTSPFKVYEYANPLNLTTAPTVFYSGNPLGGGTRLGDDLAAIGSGASTQLVAGFGAGSSGYEIITGGNATAVTFTGAPPNAGDFRLGLTFTDSGHVIGTQGSSLYRYSSFSGTTGTLLASPAIPDPAGATADRLLAYDVVDGQDLLAVESTGDNHVSIYNVNDPANPVYLASANNTTGTLTANANATGNIAWGTPTLNGDGSYTVDLYALSTSDGIQAFQVNVVPEPSTVSLAVFAAGCAFLWRRRFAAAC